MEYTPEEQYQPKAKTGELTRAWQVGDLYQDFERQVLVLAVGPNGRCRTVDEAGHCQYQDLRAVNAQVHHTGLRYVYESEQQVNRDFAAGFFTPYFEIL